MAYTVLDHLPVCLLLSVATTSGQRGKIIAGVVASDHSSPSLKSKEGQHWNTWMM